jgi:hypothetical protein
MIKIRINDKWHIANETHREMFIKYRNQNRYSELPLTENGITISRDNNDPYNGIYIQTETNNKYPICDWSDVKIFLTDREPADWLPARNYQTWAFFDYIYDNKITKKYVSRGTLYDIEDTIIDIDGISPGIVFKISRNSYNNSIYFERNDQNRWQSRISDNDWARLGYRGFYTRITMDPGMIIIPPTNLQSDKIQLPSGLELDQTSNENEQCLMCVNYKINIKFQPCNHAISCSECYIKMEQNVCPICKNNINDIAMC